ncbi:hypothetical protein GKR41_00184 [Candidatus Vallotia lariciata]|nr:hypothetical protein GKR41_00184 [Candidatus Vallotia lariciata]
MLITLIWMLAGNYCAICVSKFPVTWGDAKNGGGYDNIYRFPLFEILLLRNTARLSRDIMLSKIMLLPILLFEFRRS